MFDFLVCVLLFVVEFVISLLLKTICFFRGSAMKSEHKNVSTPESLLWAPEKTVLMNQDGGRNNPVVRAVYDIIELGETAMDSMDFEETIILEPFCIAFMPNSAHVEAIVTITLDGIEHVSVETAEFMGAPDILFQVAIVEQLRLYGYKADVPKTKIKTTDKLAD